MCEHSEDYEYSWPVSYGGAAGDYQINSPWNGPAEMMVVGVSQNGGAAYLSPAATNAGSISSIATTGTAGKSGTVGMYLNASPDGAMPLASYWFPINGTVTLVTTGNSVVILGFRRKRPTSAASQMAQVVQPAQAPTAAVQSASQHNSLPGGPRHGR